VLVVATAIDAVVGLSARFITRSHSNAEKTLAGRNLLRIVEHIDWLPR
jgi:hypothetical protein